MLTRISHFNEGKAFSAKDFLDNASRGTQWSGYDQLHRWLEMQLAHKKAEPNSGLGQAITYMLRHWLCSGIGVA